EVEVGAEVGRLAVADVGGLGLAALVVDVRVVQSAVLANVEVGAAVRAGVAPADLHADLHFEDLLVLTRPAEVGHGRTAISENQCFGQLLTPDDGRGMSHPACTTPARSVRGSRS